jgi:hypothetical protein
MLDAIGAILRDMMVPFVTTGAVYLALPMQTRPDVAKAGNRA